MRPDHTRRALPLLLLIFAAVPWPALADAQAEHARRELQRQQRIAECQNRVLARQQSYASSAEFLRARQACGATR